MNTALERYAIVRLLIVLGVLAWSIALLLAGEWARSDALPFVGACGAGLIMIALARWYQARRTPETWFIYAQMVGDIVLASAFSWLAGGHASFFVYAYFPSIAAGAWLLRLRGAIVAATLASLGYLLMATLAIGPNAERAVTVYSEGMFRVFAFYLIAMLTGHLAERVPSAGELLAKERKATTALASERDTVLAHVRAGVLTVGADRTVTSTNPFARALLGDVTGAPLEPIFPARPGRDRLHWEEERPDGQRWVLSETPLPEGGSVVLVHDMTELSKMRERAARDERLVAAGRLAASMAHEIRNPLASLSGALQLIREEKPSRLLDLAVSEAERLNRLVENFLGVAAQPRLRPSRTDVAVIAAEVCDAFSRDPRFRGRARATCVPTPSPASVDGDRVRQALWNLVLNGAQAMPSGGVVTVLVSPVREAGTDRGGVEVRVADEGVGIPEADRDRVFDPFYTTRSGGTGLGLAIVDQIVRAHGGTIAARARTGGGTEFVCWLPCEVAHGDR